FALIDVFSPCVTFNKLNTYDWFRQRIYKLEETGHDPRDIDAAFKKAREFGPKIPIGLFYVTEKPTYTEYFEILKDKPLVEQPMPSLEEAKEILEEFL
ncbi:MAG TPA: hypothetical protein VKU94_04905, partial [Geobacterales bacterium]|nr:hypothetical protein [Geobacterales bacterium]